MTIAHIFSRSPLLVPRWTRPFTAFPLETSTGKEARTRERNNWRFPNELLKSHAVHRFSLPPYKVSEAFSVLGAMVVLPGAKSDPFHEIADAASALVENKSTNWGKLLKTWKSEAPEFTGKLPNKDVSLVETQVAVLHAASFGKSATCFLDGFLYGEISALKKGIELSRKRLGLFVDVKSPAIKKLTEFSRKLRPQLRMAVTDVFDNRASYNVMNCFFWRSSTRSGAALRGIRDNMRAIERFSRPIGRRLGWETDADNAIQGLKRSLKMLVDVPEEFQQTLSQGLQALEKVKASDICEPTDELHEAMTKLSKMRTGLTLRESAYALAEKFGKKEFTQIIDSYRSARREQYYMEAFSEEPDLFLDEVETLETLTDMLEGYHALRNPLRDGVVNCKYFVRVESSKKLDLHKLFFAGQACVVSGDLPHHLVVPVSLPGGKFIQISIYMLSKSTGLSSQKMGTVELYRKPYHRQEVILAEYEGSCIESGELGPAPSATLDQETSDQGEIKVLIKMKKTPVRKPWHASDE